MLEILEYCTSDLFIFIGSLILISVVLDSIISGMLKMWSKFMRMLMVRKHGWAPDYLDADGDHKLNMKK